jgi:hypothetical protein
MVLINQLFHIFFINLTKLFFIHNDISGSRFSRLIDDLSYVFKMFIFEDTRLQ